MAKKAYVIISTDGTLSQEMRTSVYVYEDWEKTPTFVHDEKARIVSIYEGNQLKLKVMEVYVIQHIDDWNPPAPAAEFKNEHMPVVEKE